MFLNVGCLEEGSDELTAVLGMVRSFKGTTVYMFLNVNNLKVI